LNTPANIETYINTFPPETQQLLQQLRATILKAAPLAQEVISYGMPAYKLNGMLVYFAGYAKHIGFYPMASAIQLFKNELAGYKTAKGSIQFPLNKKLPVALIIKMVKFRVKENEEKVRGKK
jgi:uncharacterized protein YdhG (YjbR/CyaY superfamily)